MTKPHLAQLQREWYEKARRSGFRDIESPSGAIARRCAPKVAITSEEQDRAHHLVEVRRFLRGHRFRSAWELRVFRLYADGLSYRQIAKQVRAGRKRVRAALERLLREMHHGPQPPAKRGRRPDPDGFRAEGMRLTVRLLPAHALALDHLRTVVGGSWGDHVRRALLEAARKTVRPELRDR